MLPTAVYHAVFLSTSLQFSNSDLAFLISGESLLEVFYSDRKRWSYTFQSFALLSRFQNIEQSITEKMRNNSNDQMINGKINVFITERCLGTDFYVFTKMLREEKSMNKLEYDLYCRLYQHLKSQATPLEGIIYVSTEPDECSKRIAGRNRSGESGISIDYLQNLNQCQRQWLQLFDGPILESSDQSVLLRSVEKFVEQTIISAGRAKSE